MITGFFKNLTKEKKIFIIFILIHFVLWSCVGLIRLVLPTDSLEGIYWGSLHDFGTPKHPPLAGWLTFITWAVFKSDISIYMLSQLFICIGLIYIYKLAKFFLDDSKSMLSAIVMEGCWVYSYITGYYGFNPDVVLLCMLPIISYYFYKTMTENKASNWIILGILVGISFLNKYQTGMIIIPMFLWACIFNRSIFKNICFYLSILIAFLIFLPHLLWLFRYDFFPFMYFNNELNSTVWYNHLTAPLYFALMQLSVIIGVLVIYFLPCIINNHKIQTIKFGNKGECWFLLIIGLGPILLHLIMGILEGGNVRPRWGFEFWYMLGILLFYFFPRTISYKEFKFMTKTAYVIMIIIFLSLGTLLSVEKNYRSRYPVSQIYNDMIQNWNNELNSPLKYIGGYIEWTLPLTIYGKTNPDCILDTFGYPNPWIDVNDLKRSGILIIDRTKEKIAEYTFLSCPYLPSDYSIEPKEYNFSVTNAFGQKRVYSIYYFIIPPMH